MNPEQITFEEFINNLEKDYHFPPNKDEEMFTILDKALEKKKQLLEQMLKQNQALGIVKKHFDSLGLDDFVFRYSQPILSSGFSIYGINDKGETIKDNSLNYYQQGKPCFTFPYNYEINVTIEKNNQQAIIPISIHTLEGIMNKPSEELKEEKPTKTGVISVFRVSMQRTLYIHTKELEDAVRLYNSMKELKQVNTIAGHEREEIYEIVVNLNDFGGTKEISNLLLDDFQSNKIIKYEIDYKTSLTELIEQNIHAKGELSFYEKPSQTKLRRSYQLAMFGRWKSKQYENDYKSRENRDPDENRPTVNLDFE